MAMKMGGGAQTSMSDINITPLVDVMLVLLVIFMVTAPMLSQKKTSVQLPPVETGETVKLTDDDIILEINLDKSISFYGCKSCKSMTLETIKPILSSNQKLKEKGKLYLYGDQRLRYRYILQIMDQLNKSGVPRVGLITDPSGIQLEPKK